MGGGGGVVVNARWPALGRVSLSRRTLGKQLAGAFFAAVAARTGVTQTLYGAVTNIGTRHASSQPTPVLSFFLDQPYLDPSGVGLPYLPPQGLRGGARLARLSEQEWRHIAPHG